MDAHYSGQALEEDPHQRMSLHEMFNSFRRKYLIRKHHITHSSAGKQNSLNAKIITSTRQAQRDKHTTGRILRSLVHQRQKIIKPAEILTSRKEGGTVASVSLQ
jgi:hypothetical protein